MKPILTLIFTAFLACAAPAKESVADAGLIEDQPLIIPARKIRLHEIINLQAQNRFGEALPLCASAIESYPGDAEFLTRLGECQYALSQFADAEATLRRVVHSRPRHALAKATLALVLAQTNRPTEALKQLRGAISIEANSNFYFNLTLMLATAKPPEFAEAKNAYRRALELGGIPEPRLERLINDDSAR